MQEIIHCSATAAISLGIPHCFLRIGFCRLFPWGEESERRINGRPIHSLGIVLERILQEGAHTLLAPTK